MQTISISRFDAQRRRAGRGSLDGVSSSRLCGQESRGMVDLDQRAG
jgi:hypothetical protein